MSGLRAAAVAIVMMVGLAARAPAAGAAPSAASPPPSPAAASTILLWTLDPLGLDPGIVGKLESLLRLELARVNGATVLSLTDAAARVGKSKKDRKLLECEGDDECLARAGAAVGAGLVIAGNVGALGDHYIVNLKAVRADGTGVLRRIEEPLRGEREALIEAVRVAAYRLLAPEKLLGSVSLLTEFVGAEVFVDDKKVGDTPLPRLIADLPVGKHTLVLRTKGFPEFKQELEVRFQKTTSLLVKFTDLGPATDAAAAAAARAAAGLGPARIPWYGQWWFIGATAVVAIGIGVAVGYALAPKPVTVPCFPCTP
jgi:hypothetical protein